MVLDYLNRQKDQPDPELLRELGWNQKDLQEFTDRWNEARDLAVRGDEQDRKQWEDKLRDLGLKPPSAAARKGSQLNDTFQQMLDSGSRIRPPERLRKSFDAFSKAMDELK